MTGPSLQIRPTTGYRYIDIDICFFDFLFIYAAARRHCFVARGDSATAASAPSAAPDQLYVLKVLLPQAALSYQIAALLALLRSLLLS